MKLNFLHKMSKTRHQYILFLLFHGNFLQWLLVNEQSVLGSPALTRSTLSVLGCVTCWAA